MSPVKFLLYGLVMTVAFLKSTEGQQKCRTPSGNKGFCIGFKSCKPFSALFGKDLLTPDEYETIQKSWCPKINGVYMICCPINSLYETITIQPEATTLPSYSTNDLSTHPNLKLIPLEKCGISAFDKIARGKHTKPFEFPWMAMLRKLSDDNQPSVYCGGTLISKRYVLTAAHCLRTIKDEIKIHSVVLGEHNTNTDPDCDEDDICADPIQMIPVEKSIPHSNFSVSQKKNDIGLIRLQWDVIFSYSVLPICLPYADEFQIKGFSKVFVTGWGGTENGLTSNELMLAILNVTSNSECSTIYEQYYSGRLQITENYLCAYDSESDTCPGDSGAPAAFITASEFGPRMFQYGVLMSGVRTCGVNKGVPGAYTRVTSYIQWILDKISA